MLLVPLKYAAFDTRDVEAISIDEPQRRADSAGQLRQGRAGLQYSFTAAARQATRSRRMNLRLRCRLALCLETGCKKNASVEDARSDSSTTGGILLVCSSHGGQLYERAG